MKQRISDCSTVGQVEVEPNSSSEVYEWSLKLSPDARYFAYILKSRTVAQVHRVEDLMRTAVLEVPEGLWLEKMDFSPDGKFLLLDAYKSGRERIHSLLLYDVASGKLLRQLAIDVQYAWALSPNGKLLAVGEKVVLRERPRTLHPKVVLYEFPSGVRVGEADFPPVKEPRSNPWIGDVKKIIFTSDGKSIIATTDYTREWALEGRTASSGDGVED